MINRRIAAWANLAWNFGVHVLVRMPGRMLRDGRDAQRFLGAVVPEGYAPLSPGERDALPAMMSCIHCGLCSLACPELREAPESAWNEAWTFIAGPSRSLDRASLIDTPPCSRCDLCDAVCPTGVPITRMAALVSRLAAAAPAVPEAGRPS